MNRVLTPELIQAIGAMIIVLLTSLLPEFGGRWEEIVNAVVAILIALLTAQTIAKVGTAYFAVKSQELELRYLGQSNIRAQAISEQKVVENVNDPYYPDRRG